MAVRYVALDEFAIQKGHGYATVIVDPLHKRVLWVGRGRDVIDRARVDRANACVPTARHSSSSNVRRLLLKNRDSLRPDEDVDPRLLAANHDLFVVDVLR